MHDIAAFLIKNKLKTKLFFYKISVQALQIPHRYGMKRGELALVPELVQNKRTIVKLLQAYQEGFF